MTGIEEYEEEDYESDLKKELLAKRELKPCPFCGSEDIFIRQCKFKDYDFWYVACVKCWISIDPMVWNDRVSREEAIRIWNRRAVHED